MQITRISRFAWFKIENKGIVIHIDPGYAGYYENQRFNERYFEDKADIILITHHHKDHIQPLAIDKIIDSNTKIFAPKLCSELITTHYEVVSPGFVASHKGIIIHAVYSYNIPLGHSTRKPHHRGECVGYVIEIDTMRIYHAGDTDIIPEMSNLGPIDLAFLPIGGTFTMDTGETIRAVHLITPKLVIPMHALKADPKTFIDKLRAESTIKCIYLEPGDRMTWN